MADTAPSVDEDGVTFALVDRNRRLAAVRLLQEIGLGDLTFAREGTRWLLRVARPPVDRLEYLFEVEDGNGRRITIPDPGNPLRAPGAFGEKSVLTFPEYTAPRWLTGPFVDGATTDFEIDAPLLDGTVTGMLWSPDGLDAPAPLLVVHDGPEYASLGGFTDYVAASIAAGSLPPTRVALLGPGERNAWYSANPEYARTLVDVVLPELPPATARIGVGVSLGALAMLHAQRTRGGAFDGLLLQSGSFFTPALDGQESGFSGWQPVTEFVTSMRDAERDERPIPIAMTCGVPEENLANNRDMAASLARLGYPVQLTEVRDSHNYTAWRDALHPHLTNLVRSVVTAHAA